MPCASACDCDSSTILTPSLNMEREKISTIPSFDKKQWKPVGNKGFVKKSTSWCWVEMESRHINPHIKCSRTKWQSISKCFVHSWKTRLQAIWIALSLPQNRTGGLSWASCRSWRRNVCNCSPQVVALKDRYSASVEEWATVGCFFVRQLIKAWPMKKQ